MLMLSRLRKDLRAAPAAGADAAEWLEELIQRLAYGLFGPRFADEFCAVEIEEALKEIQYRLEVLQTLAGLRDRGPALFSRAAADQLSGMRATIGQLIGGTDGEQDTNRRSRWRPGTGRGGQGEER
jgi:hypothetical protein